MPFTQTGLIDAFVDGVTIHSAADRLRANAILDKQLIGLLKVTGPGVFSYPDADSFKVTIGTGLAVSIAAGAAIAAHTTMGAAMLSKSSSSTLASLAASSTLYIFATIRTGTPSTDSRMTGVPLFVANASSTLDGGILLASITTSGVAVTAVTDKRRKLNGLFFRGAHDAAVDYFLNDLVTYGGELWRSKTSNVAVTPVAGADWELLVAKGAAGATGATGAAGAAGATGATGAAGGSLNWLGEWTNATAYVINDAVQIGTRKSSYRCKLAHTSSATSEPGVGATWTTYWTLFAQAGQTGATGATGATGTNGTGWVDANKGAWNGVTAYVVGDVVQTNGSSYVSVLAGTNHEPPNATYWSVLVARGDTGATGAAGGAAANIVNLTDAATIAVNASLGNNGTVWRCSSAVDRALGTPSSPTDGQKMLLEWKNTDAGSHLLTLPTGAGAVRFNTDIPSTAITTTLAGKIDRFVFIYRQPDDRWDLIGYTKGS